MDHAVLLALGHVLEPEMGRWGIALAHGTCRPLAVGPVIEAVAAETMRRSRHEKDPDECPNCPKSKPSVAVFSRRWRVASSNGWRCAGATCAFPSPIAWPSGCRALAASACAGGRSTCAAIRRP